MGLLSGTQLCQLRPTSWNASSRGLWPIVLIVFFCSRPLLLFFCFGGVKIAHFTYQEASPRCSPFYSGFLDLKFCPSVLEIVGRWVPARYIRDLALFNVCSLCKNWPSARCASATNIVCRDVDIFKVRNFLLFVFFNIYINFYLWRCIALSCHSLCITIRNVVTLNFLAC
jgi:hypothetical protein